MAVKVIMPKLGLTMVEGTIVDWNKKEGEAVKEGEILFTIETEKITYEVEANQPGILGKIVAQKGDVIPIGGAVAYMLQPGEKLGAVPEAAEKAEAKAPAEPVRAEGATVPPKPAEEAGVEAKVSPLARKLAQEHGIDVSNLTGTGPGGRIVKEDILKAVEERKAAAARPAEAKPAAAAEGERLVPLSSMRRIIAKRMTESFEAPHFYIIVEADTLELGKALKQLTPLVENRAGVKLTYTDLLIKVVARALEDNPVVNCAYADGYVRLFERVDVGLVTSVEGGLIVPVVRQANKKSLPEISKARAELVQKARDKKLTKEEMTGSTFTLSNMGMMGVDHFSAILQPPEGSILAVGRIADKPVARDGQVVIRPMITMTLTIDHRVLDGADGARFLQSVKNYIENPFLLFV